MMTDWIYAPHEKLLKEELVAIEGQLDKYETILRSTLSYDRPLVSATGQLLEEKIDCLKSLRSIILKQLSLLSEYKEKA
jgi:hypothetical protein